MSRGEIAKKIEAKVIESLDELELKNCVFTTVFEETDRMDSQAGVKAEFFYQH